MENNKSPRNDEHTSEFDKAFWHLFDKLIVDSFNVSFQEGMMSSLERHAVINQIPKKEKDILFFKNCRPISLLNQDYKIASNAIAMRIQCVLPSIFHSDQCAYVKDRYIYRTLAGVMFQTDQTNSLGILIFFDFEKVFDSVNWSCLFSTLEKSNFGPSLSG